jgi:hypothetical protein
VSIRTDASTDAGTDIRTDISLDSVVVASPEQVSCELADEVVVLSLRTGEYHGLNPVAASIWGLIQGPRTVAELRDALLAEFDGVTPEQCEAELLALLAQMVELALVDVG